jgi:deazaflavin-dependent oxidoreductase (nitroreductase family)
MPRTPPRLGRSALAKVAQPGQDAVVAVGSAATARDQAAGADLPYGPRLTRLLRPVQHGFLFVNRWFMRPALRSPFGRVVGNPFTAYLLLLRTRGRRTGEVREAPLGYAILDGCVYCVAGYGVRTPWYLNLLDTPTVEVVLPGRTIRGVATPVIDDAEWLRAYRTLIAGFGLVGRLVDGDPSRLDDATLLATHRGLPVIRIRALDPPGPIVAGAWDPGGSGWRLVYGGTAAGAAAGLTLTWRLRRQRAARTRSVAGRRRSRRPSG